MGYARRCVIKSSAAGAQLNYNILKKFTATTSIFAVNVQQLNMNIFECQLHSNVDNFDWHNWDDGRKTMSAIG
jgi:hypothetical protein